MAQIYTSNGQQVYDFNGQTISASTGQPITSTPTASTTPQTSPSTSGYVNPNANYYQTQQAQTPQPITTLSSVNGQQIANQNTTKLQGLQAAYAGPSIVDYLKSIGQDSSLTTRKTLGASKGIDYSKTTDNYATENTQLLNLLRAPTNNPAQGQIVNSVNQSIQGGGATPQQIQSYSNAQDTQNQIFNDISLADAAKQKGDYSEMDFLIKRSEENTKLLNDQLAQLNKELKPLREQQLSLLTPGAREQELAKQVNDIRGQIDQFKIQTEEDKFREYEGQTLGFAGGRASEIDIRAQFKLTRMAAEQNTLLTELGLEKSAREMQGKSVEQQVKWIADDFELQQDVQDRITEIEDSVFEAAKGLRTEAKDTLSMILDSLQGVNPAEIPAQTRTQIQSMAAQIGISFEVIEQGLKAQYAQQVFDNALSSSQESRLSRESSKEEPKTLAERQAVAVSAFASAFNSGKNVPGTPVPIIYKGFITPLAWKQAIVDAPSEGLTREAFIAEFGHLLDPKELQKKPNVYGITEKEKGLITG